MVVAQLVKKNHGSTADCIEYYIDNFKKEIRPRIANFFQKLKRGRDRENEWFKINLKSDYKR